MGKLLNESGLFILYRIANLFLARDYEQCLRLAKFNFAAVCNSRLFEGNILRYKALSLEMNYSYNHTIYQAQQEQKGKNREEFLKEDQMITINEKDQIERMYDALEAV